MQSYSSSTHERGDDMKSVVVDLDEKFMVIADNRKCLLSLVKKDNELKLVFYGIERGADEKNWACPSPRLASGSTTPPAHILNFEVGKWQKVRADSVLWKS